VEFGLDAGALRLSIEDCKLKIEKLRHKFSRIVFLLLEFLISREEGNT